MLPRASFLAHFSHPPRRLQAAVLEESELTPHRARLGEMVIGALERAADALSLQAAIDGAAGAAGSVVEAALSVARSRLAELQNSEKWRAERVKAGVDHLMPKERPNEHMCAISKEPMVDPVLAADGFTYERSRIEEWLKHNDRSPKTNKQLKDKTLTPNFDLKCLIRDWEEAEHKKCMAMAKERREPPPVRQSTSDMEAELARRKKAKATAASSSAGSSSAAKGSASAKAVAAVHADANAAAPPNVKKMKVAELKEELEKRGLDTTGKKDELVARLEDAVGGASEDAAASSGKRKLALTEQESTKFRKVSEWMKHTSEKPHPQPGPDDESGAPTTAGVVHVQSTQHTSADEGSGEAAGSKEGRASGEVPPVPTSWVPPNPRKREASGSFREGARVTSGVVVRLGMFACMQTFNILPSGWRSAAPMDRRLQPRRRRCNPDL